MRVCVDNNPELVYAKFMTAYHCYDLIPTSSKLVVFDTQLNVSLVVIVHHLLYNIVILRHVCGLFLANLQCFCHQCFDAGGKASGRASSL